MASPSVPSPVLPPAWVQVLESIERSLEQAAASAPEEPPAPPPRDAAAARDAAWQQALDRLQERLEQLRGCTASAEANAAEMDALLGGGAGDLERWLTAAAEARQRLETWEARVV
jgi:hypothetical protein